MAANDGQTLAQQPQTVQDNWGGNEKAWEDAHNNELAKGSSGSSSNIAGLTPAQQAMADAAAQYNQQQTDPNSLTWQKFKEAIRQFDQQFGLNVGEQLGVYNGQNTVGEQTLMGVGANGQNTMAMQQALGFNTAGTPFLNTMEATGLIRNPDGSVTPTIGYTAQQQAGAKMILDANAAAQANPFSYLVKFGGLQNAGVLGSLLGGNIQAQTGQSLGALQSQAPYSNAQLASDLVGATYGRPVSSAGQQFLQGIGAAAPASGGSGGDQTTTGNGTFDPNAAFTSVVNALHQSQPSGTLGTNPLTGFAYSPQLFNRLSTSGQNALTDLVGTAGGQNQADFMQGLGQNKLPGGSAQAGSQAVRF